MVAGGGRHGGGGSCGGFASRLVLVAPALVLTLVLLQGQLQSPGAAPDGGVALDARVSKSMEDSSIEAAVRAKLDDLLKDQVEAEVERRVRERLRAAPAPAPSPAAQRSVDDGARLRGEAEAAPAPAPAASPAASADGDIVGLQTLREGVRCKGSQVSMVPNEFCGKGERQCMDKWEQGYVTEHAARLQRGLAALRRPGCFPHGVSVSTMGYFRTGSTMLYNTVRLWAALAAGPSLVAGWVCTDRTAAGIGVQGAKQETCSLVCKDHEFREGVAQTAAVVLMSRRDPFYSVCSRKLMDVWCAMENQEGPTNWTAINGYKKKCKTDPEMEKAESAKQCHILMRQQAAVYAAREGAGGAIAHDMSLERYNADPNAEVEAIAKAMGICSDAASDPELVKFVVQMGAELKAHPDRNIGLTQMHDVHHDTHRKAKCSNLEAFMREDPECRTWMEANASHLANAVYLKAKADGFKLPGKKQTKSFGKALAQPAQQTAAVELPKIQATCKAPDAGAPSDYCGSSDDKSCFTHWENRYIQDHIEELKPGLQAIRGPGCFPTGLSLGTMGYYRTGSTLLFNVARLWGALGAGESLLAGWFCRNPSELGTGVKGSDTESCSFICKDHTLKEESSDLKVLLMSRRDPFYSVCSRKLMDVWCRLNQEGRAESATWDEINAFKDKCMKDPGIESKETVRQCHDLMKMQAEIYSARQQSGKTVAYDMSMDAMDKDPAAEVRAIGQAMGICDEATSNAALLKFIVAMGKELKTHPDKQMHLTQMHDVHTDSQREAKCGKLREWMEADEKCKEWMEAGAAHTANSFLRDLR